ncbi:fimbrial protein [Atlantibacter sp.]|uniref:fimbrial protein n=1 Tax=Atlantibacter sp. TaxID=1903473 RepID=UPI001F5F7800|nr:fimbrial protein [Atlantibacter sp.]
MLKKRFFTVGACALLVTSMVNAADSNDTPATLSITGQLMTTEVYNSCVVSLPTASAVSLNTNGSSLADQGESVTNASPVTISVDGKTNMNNCESQMEKGQLAIRFVGIPDSSDGTVLANSYVGEDAATGVGVGIFDKSGNPLSLTDLLPIDAGEDSASITVGLQPVQLKGKTATTGKIQSSVTIEVVHM